MTPAVSVTICLYNSLRYIDETIESLLTQTWTDFEAILLDDGSTDGCAEYISAHYSDPRLKLIRQSNRGLGIARSISVSHARGEYIAFLDHDDVWFPGKLERQMALITEHPDAALIFCDCLLIDCDGRVFSSMSERYEYASINLDPGNAHDELLIRGCFISLSTALVKSSVLRKTGGPNPAYRYVSDYDMWLRLSRNHSIFYIDEPLAKWRFHDAQFTQMHPEVAAKEHAQIWRPVVHNCTYPAVLRTTVGDHLFGQQRCAIGILIRRRSLALAAGIVAAMLQEPSPILRYLLNRLSRTPFWAILFLQYRVFRFARKILLIMIQFGRNLVLRVRDFAWKLLKQIRGPLWSTHRHRSGGMHVWIDGTSLLSEQTGYFNFVCETIRSLVRDKRTFIVHVTVPRGGELVLRDRLGSDATNVQIHNAAWHWAARAASFVRTLVELPARSFSHAETTEIIIWRGHFRFARSRKVAVVHDVSTRVLPEFHTPGNVAEFDEFVAYARRHAGLIATVSEHSRREIIEHLDFRPNSVRVVLSHINPVYFRPRFSRRFVNLYGLPERYILCVGTIEPRKNLRRLVEAFTLLRRAGALEEHVLAFAGPPGWDDTFDKFLIDCDAYPCIRRLGYVPVEHMPSLYHFASAFVYPSIYEGFGLPVLEALCSSAIVLTSNVTSLAEIAGDVVKTFDPYDRLSIAEAILNALVMLPRSVAVYRKQCRARGKHLLCESAEKPSIATLLTHCTAEEYCALPLLSRSFI